MEVRFVQDGNMEIMQIDDARLIYRNFTGRGDRYNREGDRNFSVVIPDAETADLIASRGYRVKVKPPREEGEDPFITLPVKLKFNDRGPLVYLVSNGKQQRLTLETAGMIDHIDIVTVNLDIRPYDWVVNGDTGRTAYLQSIQVFQKCDRFATHEYDEY